MASLRTSAQESAQDTAVEGPSAFQIKAQPDMSQLTVVKRSGTLVPFRRERIFKALELAFRDTKKLPADEFLPSPLEEIINNIVDQVVFEAVQNRPQKGALTVEGLQDLVELKLMQNGQHDVARDYIIYRDKHKALREDSPQNIKVLRGDGSTLVKLNPMKIAASLEEAFRTAGKIEESTPADTIELVNKLTSQVVAAVVDLNHLGELITTEMIESLVEQHLMQANLFKIAKFFILARAQAPLEEEKRSQIRELVEQLKEQQQHLPLREFKALKDGKSVTVTEATLLHRLRHASRGLDVNPELLLEEAVAQFYENIKIHEIDQSLILAARTKIEIEPAYTYVASALLLDIIYKEAIEVAADSPELEMIHQRKFKEYIEKGISYDRLDKALLTFDLERLSKAMSLDRDRQFGYLGLQTLYDRYFIHEKERRLETPQYFWMRVSMGLALREKEKKNDYAIAFYHILSSFRFVSSTPTLFNAGTCHSQLSSCYLSTVMDDLHSIFQIIADDAQLSKWAGGIGNDWTNVRATGAPIKGTNGKSQGVIPFLKVANDTAVAVNQCFAPDTLIYTNKGLTPISAVKRGDLVLGHKGRYREVLETFSYNQKDPMVQVKVQHSIEPLTVTAGHPFYAIQDVPLEQSIACTEQWLTTNHVRASWVDAEKLQAGDYIAQVIPQEVIPVRGLTADDARLYGILLAGGHLAGAQWSVSGNPAKLTFVQDYLVAHNIPWQTSQEGNCLQIQWSSRSSALREGTTGGGVDSVESTLPFTYEDLYDEKKQKRLAPRLSHLPPDQTLALVQGAIETEGCPARGQEIIFTHSSLSLVEGLRYQLLRLGLPSSGQKRSGAQGDRSYDLRIPAVQELATHIGCKPLTKRSWLNSAGHLYTRVKSCKKVPVTPFVFDLKVEGDESYMTASGLAHNGGKRKGAMCAYLESWHLDVEDFLELRKNTGDERRRTHDMNIASWVPDLFMKRVKENKEWTLFSPSDVPDLHDLYGQAFEKRYEEYEKMVDEGKLTLYKRVEAVSLWRKMLGMLFETGHPWITFKDPSNIRSPQDHKGVVHSSNLCTEILLNTSKDETAVCNLGSVNLGMHITKEGQLDREMIAETVKTAMRMLDNVIDINFYPIPEAKNSNERHRPVGLGIMGFQDALYMQNVSYASYEAVEFADESMELISYYAILASTELAKERGTYSSYEGSKWQRGLLPIDTIDLLEKERGGDLEMDRSSRLDWTPVRESIKKYGMRNSNTMAIAPTATIANITGVVQSIEPTYKNLYVKSNLSGEFTIINPFLVEKLKKLGLWDAEMIDDLKYFDGSIQEVARIPDDVKKVFVTAFEVEPEWMIECASRRQKWIDMGQSLNLYMSEPSGKKLHNMYLMSWTKGLKTNYYLRTLAATQIEKSTTDINKRGLQPRWMKNKSASSEIVVERTEKPKTCSLDEGCESCQ